MNTPAHTPAVLGKILAQYQKLAAYGESLWRTTARAYTNQIHCNKGCPICCELQSVNTLEAYVISTHWKDARRPRRGKEGARGQCPFLIDDTCSIYECRPLICRTHGLVLRSDSFKSKFAVSCPYNFQEIDAGTLDPDCVLDIDTFTSNLARLNVAFCMVFGIGHQPAQRIELIDIFENRISFKAPA